jgi:hypothetical protein
MFIVTCGHRRRTEADFAREIPLRPHSIVVYNAPSLILQVNFGARDKEQ